MHFVMAPTKSRRPHLLSSTRPRNAKPTSSFSSRTTRTLVRTHHTLRKQLAFAISKGDNAEAKRVHAQIDAKGGLAEYQQASIQGQSAQRGGDTSKVLMEWLSEFTHTSSVGAKSRGLRMLEVGSLRADNACSKGGMFDMERIDLHSQHPNIEEQDFMSRPVPSAANLEHEGFDVVSLSLVVNFVSSPIERGEMLMLVETFLRPNQPGGDAIFPALFLVLPVACVANSRYLDEERLQAIMESLGYIKVKQKISAKLAYYLWKLEKTSDKKKPQSFQKQELRAGKSRNNFAITLH